MVRTRTSIMRGTLTYCNIQINQRAEIMVHNGYLQWWSKLAITIFKRQFQRGTIFSTPTFLINHMFSEPHF
jgi:hypothetical protein